MAKREVFDFRKILYSFIAVVFVIIVFTAIDYVIHSLNETAWGVPSYYFRNKAIFGIIWGSVALFALKFGKMNLRMKSFVFSAFISIVLQLRYAYEGYALNFVILFLFIHFAILWLVSYFTFKSLLEK